MDEKELRLSILTLASKDEQFNSCAGSADDVLKRAKAYLKWVNRGNVSDKDDDLN